MPKSVCVKCGTEETLLWRTVDSGQICYDCHGSREESDKQQEEKKDEKVEPEQTESKVKDAGIEIDTEEVIPAKVTGRGVRKSTRAARYSARTPATTSSKPLTMRGRGRRSLLKRTPLRAPTPVADIVTSEHIFYKGNYLQVGDIVSMIDLDGGTYYAQLRGFMTDQYNEKSAAVTWLLPTQASPSPEVQFDPATYIIGPEEELPRKLDVMQFVMHAPSDYYRSRTSPFPLHQHYEPFIWTSMLPVDSDVVVSS